MRLIDLVYYSNQDCNNPEQVLLKHKPALGFVDNLKTKANISLVKHCNYEGINSIGNVEYAFFKRPNKFFQVPFKTHRYIKHQHPDVVIVNGLVFPVQVIALKLLLGRKSILIIQHHGERPFYGIRKLFQKLADRCIAAYFFTAKENAEEFIIQGIIKNDSKCYEVLEASTYIKKLDKEASRLALKFEGYFNFLWVGRLIRGKDPLTVLTAFQKYTAVNHAARLYLIYQDEELLEEIRSFIDLNQIQTLVILVGQVTNNELATWYSAADYFISGSLKEGSGYALLEAMACGCIPVVTNIPSFNKITEGGKYGFLYEKGDAHRLYLLLCRLDEVKAPELAKNIELYFKKQLSFEKIADDILKVCNELVSSKLIK